MLLDKLDWASATLTSVLADQKPRLDPNNAEERFLYDQMARMFTGFFVAAAPEDYLTLPDEDLSLAQFKGRYPDHGIGYEFIKECQTIRDRLARYDVRNIKFLGEDFQFRKKKSSQVDQYQDADFLVLGRSDFHGLAQFLEILKNKKSEQPLIVFNHKGYWDDLLAKDGLDYAGNRAAFEAQNIFVVKSARDIKAVFDKTGMDPAHEAKPGSLPFIIKPDSLILSNTGTTHKPNEQRESFEFFGARATIVPMGLAIESAEAAPEVSWSYEGNNHEKHGKAYERFEKLGAGEVAARLAVRGKTPEQVFIMSSDSGIGFNDPDMVASALFNKVRPHLPKLKHQMQPGTELAYLIERPVANLMAGFRQSHAAKLEKLRQADPDAEVDLSIRDYSFFTVSPLVIPEGDTWEDHSITVFGATKDILLLQPALSKYGHVYSEHYMAPSDHPTTAKSEIPHHMESKSSVALGIKALMQVTKMDEFVRPQTHLTPCGDFDKASNDNRYSVAVPATISNTKSLRHSFRKACCETIPASDKRFGMDYETGLTIDVKAADGQIIQDIVYSRRHKDAAFIDERQAFWFPPVENNASDLEKIRELKFLSNIIVDRQIYAPSALNKAIVIGNPYLIKLIDDLHRMKLVGDRPHHLYERADNHRQAAKLIRTLLDRQYVAASSRLPVKETGGVLDDEGLYKVAVFNSASTKNDDLKDPEYAFAYALAMQGLALVNGGGSQGSMFETQKGYADGRAFSDSTQPVRRIKTSSAAYQSYDTYKIEGLCNLPDYYSIEPTRGMRIDKLTDVNCIVAGAGGIGTVEEILEESENILLGAAERPRLLVNVPIKTGKGFVKCHDPILELLPSSVLKHWTVLDNHEEALEVIMADRAKKGLEMQYVQRPAVTQAPKIAFG